MNKERKVTLTVITDVLKSTQGPLPRRTERALEKGIESIKSSEERAQRAMEPYKDDAGTAANYRNAAASITHLQSALDSLVDQDLDTAVHHLDRAMDPSTRPVTEVARAPRARKKARQ